MQSRDGGPLSNQTRFEQTLEKQRDWFSRILNSLPERVIVYDADYNVVFCNIPEVYWRGRKCYEFIHSASQPCPDTGRDHPCAVREIIHQEKSELEFTYEIGELRYRVHAAPIINLDGRRGAVEIVIDETERKKYERIEQELQETVHRLNALQITRTFGQSLDLGEIGGTLTRQLKKLLPLRAVQFWLHKDKIHDCYTFFPDLPGIPLWEADQQVVPPEVQEVYQHQRPRVWQAAGETHLSFPLIYNGESIGVWTVSLSSEAYQPAHQEVLTVIADRVSMAVGHALTFLTERLARAVQQYLHSVLESSSDGICIMRADGEIRYANDAIRRLLSLPAVSCRDLHVFRQPGNGIGPIHIKDIRRVLDYVLTHEHWQAELDVIEEGEIVQTYLVSASLIKRADQDVPDILWYIKDVTIQQRLQAQMRRAERLSAVAELASFISHEIRNPLAAIESAAEMLNGGESLSEEDRELLRIVQSEAQRVNNLLNTYLQYARMSVPKKREVDVHELLRDTVQFVTPSLPSSIQVKLNLESGVSVIAADAIQLRQAFLNLIRNAVEAMPEGGLLEITTWWEEEANNLAIAFRDTGEGVDLSAGSKLFEPFFSTKAEGVGLGLAIVQRVVQGHDGSAEITNHPEGGAYVTLRLPVVRKEIHE